MKRPFCPFRTLAAAVPLPLLALLVQPVTAQTSSPATGEPETRTVSFTTTEGTYLAFDISPDGQWAVFDLLGQLWRIPAKGSEAVPLTQVSNDLDSCLSPESENLLSSGTGTLRSASSAGAEPLPWDELAGVIVERMDLVPGEKVLLLGASGRFEAMVGPLQQMIVQVGGEYLGALPTSLHGAPVAGSDFMERLWQRRVAAHYELFREVDATVILPGAGGPEYVAVQEVLREERGRAVHFHWAGAMDLAGRAVPVTAEVDSVYRRALLETDYLALGALQREFEEALRRGQVRVTTPAGTDIRFAIGDRPVTRQDGDASARRAKEARNLIDREVELPAGAVRVAPLEETVEGVMVIPLSDWSGAEVRGLRMWFEEGRATSIEAEAGLDHVLQELERAGDPGRAFREFALGMNPLLAIPDGGDWIPNYGYGAGVVRLSLGDNTELGGEVTGGYVRWNLFPDATVHVAGEPWVRDGLLLRLPGVSQRR